MKDKEPEPPNFNDVLKKHSHAMLIALIPLYCQVVLCFFYTGTLSKVIALSSPLTIWWIYRWSRRHMIKVYVASRLRDE